MGEVRAAFAIARKDIRNLSRYRIAVASMVFTPLYQFVIPAFLFGAAFAVEGRAAGLEATLGTDDLVGFIFIGGVVGGIIATAFWAMAMSLRNEMDAGTLEPSWLTPTRHETFVVGRALGGLFWFLGAQVALFAFGVFFLGLRLRIEMLAALPAVLCAMLAMVGVAYVLAAIVLLIREANFFIDTANFLRHDVGDLLSGDPPAGGAAAHRPDAPHDLRGRHPPGAGARGTPSVRPRPRVRRAGGRNGARLPARSLGLRLGRAAHAPARDAGAVLSRPA
jgi:ABC-type transport system involved in cytochrome c biogenesis permease component